eukprot:867768-Rhodomonas_salina.1
MERVWDGTALLELSLFAGRCRTLDTAKLHLSKDPSFVLHNPSGLDNPDQKPHARVMCDVYRMPRSDRVPALHVGS